MSARVEILDRELVDAWKRLIATGQSPVQALREIGRYNVTATRLRFRAQAGPDGVRWKPSKRVKLHGGQTLRLHGLLRNSITSNVIGGGTGVEWGSSMKYAAAHQFGIDEIQNVPKSQIRRHTRRIVVAFGKQLKRARRVTVNAFSRRAHTRHMNIPARPFLGVNDQDRAEMLRIMAEFLQPKT